ncbi:hypothetical protein [Haloplanus natans]|uniref:hypothetical protein n=1 Tax=Haloplanus natans TaxID=376171 RepID=UPI0012F775DB|nr:hypothetical protein [Haloplanus natans]
MRRRRLLGLLVALPVAGCTGGPGDPITSLAVNRDDTSHTVAVRIVRDGQRVIENTVTAEAEGVAELGTAPWRRGRYRVTAGVDGEPVVETAFVSEEWFNQFDVVVRADGLAALNRGRAA